MTSMSMTAGLVAVRPVSAATRSSAGCLGAAAAARRCVMVQQTRSFTILPRLRPTLASTSVSSSSSIFRSASLPTTVTATAESASPVAASVLDLVAAASISRHPALAGLASQIRCGPRPTMERTSRLVQKRRHGFLSRVRTKSGRKTLSHRRTKGRKRLSH